MILLLVSGLIACAPVIIDGRVSAATYQLPPSGATFTVLSSGSTTLTERHIQELITKEMQSRGYNLVEASSSPDYAIMYSYSIGGGKTIVSSSRGGHKVDSSTHYPRYFQISIVDVVSSLENNQYVFAWQSEIYSSGSSQNVRWLAEHFVPKLFEAFGKTISNERMIMTTTVPAL